MSRVWYLDPLDASADNLSVVICGAQRARVLALPQEVKSATITCPLRTFTVKETRSEIKSQALQSVPLKQVGVGEVNMSNDGE